jgi:hypothetical protein
LTKLAEAQFSRHPSRTGFERFFMEKRLFYYIVTKSHNISAMRRSHHARLPLVHYSSHCDEGAEQSIEKGVKYLAEVGTGLI